MRARNTIRFDTNEGCCFMLLFMQPQQHLSIPFPHADRDSRPMARASHSAVTSSPRHSRPAGAP